MVAATCRAVSGGGNGKGGGKPKQDIVEKALAIRDQHLADLEDIKGVVGTGVGIGDGTKGVAIEVYVEKITPEIQRSIPRGLDGVPVRVIATGKFSAY